MADYSDIRESPINNTELRYIIRSKFNIEIKRLPKDRLCDIILGSAIQSSEISPIQAIRKSIGEYVTADWGYIEAMEKCKTCQLSDCTGLEALSCSDSIQGME